MKRMTWKMFLRHLRSLLKKDWTARLDKNGAIRLRLKGDKRCYCPLTAVTKDQLRVYYSVNAADEVARKLGLLVTHVVVTSAADDSPWINASDKIRRRDMLRALKLKEPKKEAA